MPRYHTILEHNGYLQPINWKWDVHLFKNVEYSFVKFIDEKGVVPYYCRGDVGLGSDCL